MNSPPDQLLTTHVIEPAGWMLVHSVWQLATLAALLAVLLHLLRRRSAELRYAVSAIVLFAMVIWPGVTFWMAMPPTPSPGLVVASTDPTPIRASNSPQPVPLEVPSLADIPIDADAGTTGPPAAEPTVNESTLRQFASVAFPWLVGLWSVGVFLLSVWNIGGWIAVQRLVKLGVRPITDELQAAANRLARQLGLSRAVRVVQSAVVDVPSVVGWLRPTVLLPIAVVTGLSPAQLEAILAHELAHIRRCDYLANLMQTVAETLLFYHPAVWYVSRRMRIEREYVADRLAADLSESRTAYAAALTTLEEQTSVWSKTAVAATGGSLLARIRRVLGLATNDAGRTGSWLLGAAGSLVAMLMLVLVPSVHAAIVAGRAPRVTMQRIWADANTDTSGCVSPDGKMLAYINWENGNLGVHNFEEDTTRELTTEGTWYDPNQCAEAPVWSPDSQEIAYTWFIDHQPPQVRVISREGGPPRILHRAENGGFVYTCDWAPDGKHILAFTRDGTGGGRTVLIRLADGAIQPLRGIPDKKGRPDVSPDGRFAAFDGASPHGVGRDIYLYEMAKADVTPLITHPADDHSLIWSPDGNWLTFISDRGGTDAAWILPIADGQPAGAAQLLSPPLPGAHALGITNQGRYIVGVYPATWNVYVVDYDPDNRKVQNRPRLLVRLFEGRNFMPLWSPDGKRLLFLSVRPTPRGGKRLVPIVRDEASGRERIIDLPSPPRTILTRLHASWTADGNSVLIGRHSLDEERQPIIETLRCDVETGHVTPLVTHRVRGSIEFAISPAATSLYYAARDGDTYQLVRRSISEAREEKVATLSLDIGPQNMAISPDGTTLAVSGWFTLWFVDLQTHAARLAYRTARTGQGISRGAAWSADGEYLVFAQSHEKNGGSSSLWRIAASGGEPQPLGLRFPHIELISLHPNGRQLAFGGQLSARASEVWAVEHSLLMQEGL